ncbi:MAG: hypothetical protein PHT43_00195 [Anaerolineaceae bacterium]|nr:hypothetical protein [Anaerolineaceae bacterium]
MQTLVDWEKRLKPFFDSGLRIIGEIPLNETDVDELAEEVRNFLAGFDKFTRATNVLTKRFPYVFMTLLAHFSMYNDQSGYWHALQLAVGADQDLHITLWHRKFVNLARQNDLKTFDISDTPNYYVASIRFHGGIPSYYLPDFFERMVVPAVTQQDLRHIPPKEAMNYLLQHAYLGRPVLDFLENSGEMGLAWFEACCKLVRHARENHGEVLPISAVPELPYNIHTFFEQYSEEREDRGFHWSRPYLEVNPLSEESPVILRIPEQIVTTQAASQLLHWTITWPGQNQPIIEFCEVYHRRSGEFTTEVIKPIPIPTTQVTVSISSSKQDGQEDSELRRWTLPLLPAPDQAPLVAFRANFRQVPNAKSLPAQVLFLLTPKTAELEIDSATTERVDSFSTFSGGWKDWKLEQWDLTHAISLLLHQDGQVLGNIVPVAREVDLPELWGGHRFDYQENLDQPLYTSGIPSVSIPVSLSSAMYQALRDWKVRAISIGEAAPTIDRQVAFLEYQDELLFEGSRAILSLEKLLGEKPAGIYEIRVSGPRGIKADFRLRLWPKLLLQNYSKELPKAEESRDPVEFNVYLQDGAWVETQAGADPVEIAQEGNGFSINAAPHLRSIALDLVTISRTGEYIRVPVSIPVVRLRWGLVEENMPNLLEFGQTVFHVSKERFSQYESRALHVEMHGLSGMLERMRCQLVESDNENNLLQLADFRKTGFKSDWLKVSLLQFSETIRAINTQVQFQLVFQKDNRSPLIRYALLEISPEMDVRDARLEQVSECDWKLIWKEDLPLKNRRVMLKSAWLPWAPTIEEKIPDENRGEYTFRNIALPPSSFEIYFYTKFKWEPTAVVPPENAACLEVDLISPVERLAFLEKPQQGHDAQFRQLIEKACILDRMGNSQARDEVVSASATHLRHLRDIQTLVGTIKWMRETDNMYPPIKSFFYQYTFHQSLVNAMLEKYPQGDANLIDYLHLITPSIYADSARILLEKVDDPLVTSTCIKALINRKDDGLLPVINSMISQGRISAESAAELLTEDPNQSLWALEIIADLNQSDSLDNLLKAILPSIVKEYTQTVPEWLEDVLLRALTVEKSRELILRYLKILVELDRDEVWKVLVDKERLEQVTHEEFIEFLKSDPEKALEVLRQHNDSDCYSEDILKLEEEFPSAAGLLTPGMTLSTPFGVVQIVSIKLVDGTRAQSVKKADVNFILKVTSGSGLDRIEADLDFSQMTLQFRNEKQIYCCSVCNNFCHPKQHRLNEHHRQTHPYDPQAFILRCGSIPFTINDIQHIDAID